MLMRMPTSEVRDNSGEEATRCPVRADRGSSMNEALGILEPRWPATVALLAVHILRLVLPASFWGGSNRLLLAVLAAPILPTIWAHDWGCPWRVE